MARQLLPRSVLSISGPDAYDFLDALLTNTVSASATLPVFAALLTPQGKLVSDMILWPQPEGVLIDLPRDRTSDVLSRLRLYKLRSAVEIEDVSDRWAVEAHDDQNVGAPDPRLDALPRRMLSTNFVSPPADEPSSYRALRVELGVPDPAYDAGVEELFGLEALLDELNGVDFHKGCFVGQENVSRMKRRATTRRKLCRVRFEGRAPDPGAIVTDGAAELGSVRSVGEGAAIAVLRLDRAQEALAEGRVLTSPSGALALDPPAWMILPVADSAP